MEKIIFVIFFLIILFIVMGVPLLILIVLLKKLFGKASRLGKKANNKIRKF